MNESLLASVAPVAQVYRLALLQAPARARVGEILSRRPGGSVEIEDFRPYTPGDDPRHIDWAAFARSDQVFVRLHRAEVRLAVEVLLDRSVSMTTGDGSKERRVRELALLFARLAGRSGASLRLWAVGDRLERVEGDPAILLESIPFDGRAPLPETLGGRLDRLEAGSVRIVLSDFLYPHDPESLHSHLARTAGGLAMVQVLAPEEIDPPRGLAQLVDVETGEDRPLDHRRGGPAPPGTPGRAPGRPAAGLSQDGRPLRLDLERADARGDLPRRVRADPARRTGGEGGAR